MTAAQAIASIREDIGRLEAKNLVKPGFIHRKRREADAIAAELETMEREIEQLKRSANQLEEENRETDLRLGMLANVLNMAGIDPMVHLRRPLGNNPDIYYQASVFVEAIRRHSGLLNRFRNYTIAQLKDIISHAIWTARLHRATAPTVPIEQLAHEHEGDRERAA